MGRACARSEQPIEFLLGNGIALARAALQAAAVEVRNVAALVADQTGPLQGTRRGGNAGPLHPKHHGQELLCEQKFIRLHAVVLHQQPVATSLLQGMKLIACSSVAFIRKLAPSRPASREMQAKVYDGEAR